jgi:hypothetical protein
MTQFTERETANSFLRERNVVTAAEQKMRVLCTVSQSQFFMFKIFLMEKWLESSFLTMRLLFLMDGEWNEVKEV